MTYPIPALVPLDLPNPLTVPGRQHTVDDALRLREKMVDPTHVTADENGVIRWNSNKAIVPTFVYKDAYCYCPRVQWEVYDKDSQAFLAEYRKADPLPDAEQLSEMAANFPPGSTVVNIVTGRRTRLPGRKPRAQRER